MSKRQRTDSEDEAIDLCTPPTQPIKQAQEGEEEEENDEKDKRESETKEEAKNKKQRTNQSEDVSPTVKYWLKTKGAYPPTRGTARAAGIDVYACRDVCLIPHQVTQVDTGITVQAPKGHYFQVGGRSGLFFRKNVEVFEGIIDEDYTGNIMIGMINRGNKEVDIKAGTACAQLMLHRAHYLPLVLEDGPLPQTERGEKGFGSTDKTQAQEASN